MIAVKYFVTDKSITLYWDKPYDLPVDYALSTYRRAGDRKHGKTRHTDVSNS